MIAFGDYESIIKQNRLAAFKQYVGAWKKQNPDTVKVEGDIYSYRTKRGLVKRFRASDKVTSLKVNSFYFEEIQ